MTNNSSSKIEEDRLKQQYTSHLYLNPFLHIFFAYDTTTGEIVGMSAWEAPSQSPYSSNLRRRLSWLERIEAWYASFCDLVSDYYFTYLFHYLHPLHSSKTQTLLQRKQFFHNKKTRWAHIQSSFRTQHINAADHKKGYWTLAYLGVLPSHGRRGIGQQLLQWGLERADEEGRSVYISASVQGVGLYGKVGAEVVESRVCMEGEEKGGWMETWMRRRNETRKVV